MSQEDDFLEMLARLDEEAEAQKKEVITVETPIFDSVKHIAALLERKNKEVAKKNEDYLEGLKQNYLLGPIETSFLIELLMKETEKVNLQIDKKSKDFKNVVLSASKRLGQEIGRISEDIKIPEETIKPIQVKEEPLEYLTLTGQFLPISPEALLVADQLYDSLKNFRTVIKDTKSAEELSKLVLIQSLSELITDKMIKEKLFAQLKGNETKDEVALYSLISVANPAFVDRKFFDVVKNYKQVINLRKKASANIAENLRHVVRNDINYAVMANGINTRIIEELGRIIQPFEKIKDEKTFKNFTKTLVDQVLNPKYVVNHDDKDFKSGEAIITKEGFKFKKGTVGVVKDNCPTHKGNILFTPQEFAEECIPKETLLKLENLLDQVVPVEGKPKVGDLVVITKGGGYTVTRDGSWGYVREINDYKAEIEFHHLTGDKRTVPQSFPIENDHFRKAELKKGKKKEIIGKQYLRKGDVVKLRKESEFAAQNKDEGKIIDIDLFNEEFPYMVEFKDGYENNYGEKDLEIANKKSTRAKEITKQKEQDEKKNNTDLEEKTRLTIAVNIIVDEETGKVKEAREKNEKTVKDSLEQLICLGITKEIAHFFVKKHLRNYVSFVDAGILISDEEEQKFFNKIKDLAVKVHGKEAFYNDLAQKICKEIEQKYDLILAREKITNEKEFNVFKENIGEIFYNNSYNKAPKGKVKEPGLVVVVKDGENVPLGTVGVLENTEVCGGCGYYHYFVPVDGMQTKVAPESIRRVEKLFPLVEEGEIKKGAKVKIRKDSQFYGQADGPGKVKNNFGEEGDIDNEPGAKVVFDNGYQNTYRKKDLELVNPVVVDPVLYAKKQEIINRELPTLKKIVENQTPKADDNEQKLADLFFSVKSELETLGFTNQTVKEYVYEKIGDRAYRNLMALGFVE